MTVAEFLELISNNPFILILYFSTMPFIALLALIFGKGEGHLSPWKYLYTCLVYMVCIPGIFGIAMVLQSLLIERQSFMNLNIYVTLLPLVSMALTLFLIKRNVPLDYVPGFDRITGFMMMIFVCIVFFWALTRIRVLAVTYIPFHYFLIVFLGLLLLMVFGWRRLFK